MSFPLFKLHRQSADNHHVSVLGTGVAAGVAQTQLTAQQVARQRDRRGRDLGDEQQRVREVFDQHIRGLEENDATDGSAARLTVDTQTGSDHEDPVEDAVSAPVQRDGVTIDGPGDHPKLAAKAAPAASPYDRRSAKLGAKPLYQHVDIQA